MTMIADPIPLNSTHTYRNASLGETLPSEACSDGHQRELIEGLVIASRSVGGCGAGSPVWGKRIQFSVSMNLGFYEPPLGLCV